MRLKLVLEQVNPSQEISINYQYYISSFIYHTIESSNNDYSAWLHDKGFLYGKKSFKFFTFSMLNIPEREIANNRIKILSRNAELTLSMLSDKTSEHVVIGMFKNQRLKIYDELSEAEFLIRTVEAIPVPKFTDTMRFRTISPVVLSKRKIYNNKLSAYYLNPEDDDYFQYFKKNIEEKYITYCLNFGYTANNYTISSFKLLGNYKTKLITIAENKEHTIRQKGYLYDFEITGNPEMLSLGYEAGFGKSCSLGFGCVKVL